MAENKNETVGLADELLESTSPKAETAASSDKKKRGKTVIIKLEKTRENKEPLWVGLNGHKYVIKRGVEVEVPVGVAKIVARMIKAENDAMDYEESISAPEDL